MFICSKPLYETTLGSHLQHQHDDHEIYIVQDSTNQSICLECSRSQLRNPRLTMKQKSLLLRNMRIGMESRLNTPRSSKLTPMLFQEDRYRSLLQRLVETLMQQLDANEESSEYANALVDFYHSFLCLERAMPRAMKIAIEALEDNNSSAVRLNAHLELIVRACDKKESTKRSVASYTILTKSLLRSGFKASVDSHTKTICADLLVRLVCCGCERSVNAFADALGCVFEILNCTKEIDVTKALILCVANVQRNQIEKYFESDSNASNFVKLLETRLLLLDTKTSVPTLTLNLTSSVVSVCPSISKHLVSSRIHELVYELLRDVKIHGIRLLLLIFRNAKIRDCASALRVALETITSGIRMC